MNDIDAFEDYKKLIKAVIDHTITDYIKYQHPLNRKTKTQKKDFVSALKVFFDPTWEFQHFYNPETGLNMSTQDMLACILNGAEVSMSKAQNHVIQQSVDYWWSKHFYDLEIPEIIVISGIVWNIMNSPKNEYIDWDNQRIYLPLRKKGSDRKYLTLVLQILLKESEVTMTQEEFQRFHKLFYLFLKVNNQAK